MSDNKRFEVRMYTIGTGDCFVVKLFGVNKKPFHILIDCGVITGTYDYIREYVKDLIDYVESRIDLLIVTHEHKDHVYGFQAAEKLWGTVTIHNRWFAWSEDDDNSLVKSWKEDLGQKKKKLHFLSQELKGISNKELNSLDKKSQKLADELGLGINGVLGVHRNDFDDDEEKIHNFGDNVEELYIGGMKGMNIAKGLPVTNGTKYLSAGDVLSFDKELPNLKFYILGPPKIKDQIKKEKGKKGTDETYDHSRNNEFGFNLGDVSYLPDVNGYEEPIFKADYVDQSSKSRVSEIYENDEKRKIDYDWLLDLGAAELALRIQRGLNNLSLVMAIEFVDTREVLLFPGDAEIGSWESWHDIDWKNETDPNGNKLTTENLLNRVIFYKVAHHLSHNGTAKEEGLDMMTSDVLAAMATVDYNKISTGWTNTMPNRYIVRELMKKTRGKFYIANEEDLKYHKDDESSEDFDEAREVRREAYNNQGYSFDRTDYYVECIYSPK